MEWSTLSDSNSRLVNEGMRLTRNLNLKRGQHSTSRTHIHNFFLYDAF